jgi:hypothetical protein
MRLRHALWLVGFVVALAVGPTRADDPPDAGHAKPPPAPALPPDMPSAPPIQVIKPPDPTPEQPEDAPGSTHNLIPEMLGDQAPVSSLLALPPGLSGRPGKDGVILVPSARDFKISDNDSPRPQSRTYFSFNYFYNLDGVVNRLADSGIQRIRIHRETFGVEWAADDGSGSFGLRLPLNTFNAANTVPWLDGTSTDIGDLGIIFKYLLWSDPDTGNLISAGLLITAPTGPGSFAGSNNIKVFHNTGLQPFCGSIWNFGPLYVQHFTAVDAPTDLNDVVILSNDVGLGYFLYQKRGESLSAVVPTVEVHINTPLNHRGVLGLTDPAGTPDMVDLTGGVNFEYCDRSALAVGFAVPVTGPRAFDFEILAQLRWRY